MSEIDELKAKLAKAETLNRILEHTAQVHEAQYRLERENSKALANALMRSAPEAWNAIKDTLNQSNNERDKVYCEVTKRFNRLTEAEAENERLRAALAWYADYDNYEIHSDDDGERMCFGELVKDRGNRARQALAAVGKAEGGE